MATGDNRVEALIRFFQTGCSPLNVVEHRPLKVRFTTDSLLCLHVFAFSRRVAAVGFVYLCSIDIYVSRDNTQRPSACSAVWGGGMVLILADSDLARPEGNRYRLLNSGTPYTEQATAQIPKGAMRSWGNASSCRLFIFVANGDWGCRGITLEILLESRYQQQPLFWARSGCLPGDSWTLSKKAGLLLCRSFASTGVHSYLDCINESLCFRLNLVHTCTCGLPKPTDSFTFVCYPRKIWFRLHKGSVEMVWFALFDVT